MESSDDRADESGYELVKLPVEVARSSRLLVRLTAPRFGSVEEFVVEAVRDVLDAIEHTAPGKAATRAARPPADNRRRRGPQDPVRVHAMHERYLEGQTLQEVGDEFGVTRERVRQLFVAARYSTRRRGERLELRLSRDDERADEVIAAYRELGDVNEVAGRVGISVGRVRALLARHGVDLRAYRRERGTDRSRYREEEILDCVRHGAAEEGILRRGILTGQAYERFRRDRTLPDGRPWPSSQTVSSRFGSWRSALERLGLPANPPSPVAGRRQFDERACVDAVREVRRLLGRLPSAGEYSELAPGLDGMPSMATVRHVVGSWQRALRLAAS